MPGRWINRGKNLVSRTKALDTENEYVSLGGIATLKMFV